MSKEIIIKGSNSDFIRFEFLPDRTFSLNAMVVSGGFGVEIQDESNINVFRELRSQLFRLNSGEPTRIEVRNFFTFGNFNLIIERNVRGKIIISGIVEKATNKLQFAFNAEEGFHNRVIDLLERI